ncbi:hypothetical protein BDN72DRAFT_843662 [Pluteus cervinus]|uniref:Uncharacterized protein n=1 Tax=Pluteus cervinus TaxID=181527 RepID=A0ACD3AME9_9AGAR|nr:hypothetical protein BDN72DRAFT_843662 [Pluteus cervinus]
MSQQDDTSAYPPSPSKLPLELERDIFEISARSSHQAAGKLLAVSKHVASWIEPIFYQAIVLCGSPDDCRPLQMSKRPMTILKKYGKHVRSIFINHIGLGKFASKIPRYLACCPAATNLSLWCGADLVRKFSVVRRLPLRRLSIEGGVFTPDAEYEIDPKSFPTLTHLHLVLAGTRVCWQVLILIPNLTHLGLSDAGPIDEGIPGVLQHCKSLRVILVIMPIAQLSEAEMFSEEDVSNWRPGYDDDRVVVLHCKVRWSWLQSAEGKEDMWEFADEVVAERKAKKLLRRAT